jgi:hypothetical protein
MVVMSTTVWKEANSGFRWKDKVQNQRVYNSHFAPGVDNGLPKLELDGPKHQQWAWSEPAATNAPVQDEPVEAVLRMNKNPILPTHMDFFFFTSSLPQIFPPILPTTYLPPLPTTYLPPPTYHLPTPPPLTPSPELQRRRAGASLELELGLFEQEFGIEAWSCRSLELGAVGTWELWLEPERDPRRTQVSIFTFFLICLFCLFFFAMFLWSCAAAQHNEEGNVALRCSVAKKATLRCTAA